MGVKVLVISSYDANWLTLRPEGEWLIGLHKAGVALTIMTQGDSDYGQRFRAEGIRVVDYQPKRKRDPEAIRLIRQLILDEGFQVVHVYTNKALTNTLLAAWRLSVKIVAYRGYTGNISWYNPFNYLTYLNPRIDYLTCVSDGVREEFERQLFFPAGKAITVNKGHDPAWYANVPKADLTEWGIPEEAIVVSLVANIRRMKGLIYLLQATYELPLELPIHILLIGRNMENKATRRLVEKSPYRDRIHYAGFQADALPLVHAADISVSASIYGEGLSKTILEAMFLGVPTIMTSIAGNRGLAVHQESGWVVPPRNAKALAEGIVHLAQDEVLRQKLGQAGKAHVTRRFSLDRSIQELKLLYERWTQVER